MGSKFQKISQSALILEYFKNHPGRDISHPEIVDWAVQEWLSRTGHILRDPDRAIRKLAQGGTLVKVGKGIYRYDPDFVAVRVLEDFNPIQKKVIIERDGYRCVICGRGRNDGVELHVDHIKPKDFGGTATVENGQTLCAQHNFLKKNYSQTELGKKMLIRLYELSKKDGNVELQKFASDVLEVFERYDIDNHIEWEK